MLTQRESTSVVGHHFENRVATLLRLFGYNVGWDGHVNGNPIGVYATVERPTQIDTILVECKDYAKTIGVDS